MRQRVATVTQPERIDDQVAWFESMSANMMVNAQADALKCWKKTRCNLGDRMRKHSMLVTAERSDQLDAGELTPPTEQSAVVKLRLV